MLADAIIPKDRSQPMYVTSRHGVIQIFDSAIKALRTFYPENDSLDEAYWLEIPVARVESPVFIPIVSKNERALSELVETSDYLTFGRGNHSITKVELK